MKRVLIVLLFLFVAVAVWFRWLDDLNPQDVKVEVQTQAEIMKEKAKTFSFKDELNQIVTALDHFFSPKDRGDGNMDLDYVVLEPNDLTAEMMANHAELEAEEVVTEEQDFKSTEEATLEQPEMPMETNQTVVDFSMGYPAPIASTPETAPMTIVEAPQSPAPVVEQQSAPEELMMDFSQLQDAVPGSFLPYNLQSISPLYMANFVHPEAACNWMGVAGQIFGDSDNPQDGLVVVVEGAVNNGMIEVLGYSGLAGDYGPGGYELVLSTVNKPGIFWIQLFDQKGKPLSGIYSFQMDGTCEKNLAIINFSVKTEVESKYVPTVMP